MNDSERLCTIFGRVDEAITLLRKIRRVAQSGKPVPADNFDELAALISSLRHNVEMHNGKAVTS